MKADFPTPSMRPALSVRGSGALSRVGSLFMEDQIPEEWRAVVGYEGIYEVSNYGKVRRVARATGYGNRKLKVMFLTSDSRSTKGYPIVGIRKDGKTKTRYVHKLVAQAFIPNPLNLPEVDHEKGNKEDSRAWMLKWVTRAQNIENALALDLFAHRHGEENPNVKLTEKQVLEIRARSGERIADIADEFGISWSQVKSIRNRKTWKHI